MKSSTLPSVARQPQASFGCLARPSSQHRSIRCHSSSSSSFDVPEAAVSVRANAHTSASTSSVADVAEACCSQAAAAPPTAAITVGSYNVPVWAAAAAGLTLTAMMVKHIYDTPMRTYNNNVGDEYDSWTQEGILEYYWGDHIHLGYYTEEERAAGWWKADFKANKIRFIEEMLKWSGATKPKRILDVGCGFGGTSRHLAAKFPDAQVTGITLSPKQVERGTELARERGLTNVEFKVMDALKMEFEDDTFDLVWACESGEHMPDKKAYVEQMTRVLAPGGHIVIACWCQREETPDTPFSKRDRDALQFLYDEWAHPFFISKEEFCRLMQGTGKLEQVATEDWTPQTLPTWRHSNLVGVLDPWIVVFKLNPVLWYKVTREIVTIERMHRAFDRGLMEYGMMKAVKPPRTGASQQVEAAAIGQHA